MGDVASTRSEANAQLRRLLEDRGFGENGNVLPVLVSSLNNSLNTLSTQLYSKPTHFLLELIQNADDNVFHRGVIPRLHLSLYQKDGKAIFRSDCNEIGFTFQQLDALTRIGGSTKKAADGYKGYIGEKGIGFKSVFKVADLVRVASGCYEFKFDARKTIGMMLPRPSKFPEGDRLKNNTQFLLELKRKEDYTYIKDDLRNIKPEIFLFLQNLEQLDITIDDKRKIYKHQSNACGSKLGGETAIISETTDKRTETTKYLIERQTVEDLPSDPRRDTVAASEVVVAFPIKDQSTPIVESQQIFAFLPVQNHGFKVILTPLM
ncbi:hypothetical protein KVR01_013102 [Diaporthe batatas]|uniref:uncharacterized protein n=1 Tax=Diaporthe batatas TaxID=748121 RepID=UPI001D035F23|nr:uncharacterized protein KVR01_013102 [Diaporthe batatas]KAG8157112.1 hypothetical protein KVR01_013102 [Diaporthe batatas]